MDYSHPLHSLLAVAFTTSSSSLLSLLMCDVNILHVRKGRKQTSCEHITPVCLDYVCHYQLDSLDFFKHIESFIIQLQDLISIRKSENLQTVWAELPGPGLLPFLFRILPPYLKNKWSYADLAFLFSCGLLLLKTFIYCKYFHERSTAKCSRLVFS